MRQTFSIAVLAALLLGLGSASLEAADKPWNFQVRNNGPETLRVGCQYNSGSTIPVGSAESVQCSGSASYNTYVYFGDRKARKTHNCPVNQSVYVRYIAYSYDSGRDNSFQVDETYCEVVATTDGDDDDGGTEGVPGT